MGVDGRLLNRRKPEMNDRAPHTAPEVPPCPPVPEPSEDVPTVKLFDPWREAEDIEVLKSKMKLQLRREVVGEVAIPPSISGLDSVSSMLYKSAGGHEMSMSLPNLSSSLKTEDINTTNDKLTRSSLSDIYDSAPVEFQIVNDKSHSDLAKELDLNRLRLNECPPCREKGGRGHVSTGLSTDIRGPKLLKPSNTVPGCSEPRDLTINVSQCNNRLSAVLENIPLFYIPHTKQLISVNPGTSTNAKADSKNAAEHHSIPKLQCQSEPSCDTILAQTHSDFADFCAVESHDDTLTSPPGPTLCLQNGGTAQPVTNGGINSCNTSLSKTKFLSNSDLENSMALSQDSDASSRSEHTVIHQDEYHSQGKHEDFDAESIDELTKISLERDSPKHPLHRTSTMGSINDASSFSSISSISTGTDFSASATSYSDDYIDVKGVVTDCDEAGFMDVNLHSRNTFERSRNSSQDSGIDEKGFHGAKPKRRGITGFFTRSLFSKKPKDTVDQSQNQSAPGWKLFGRIPPKHTTPKDPTKISQEYQAKYKVQQQQPQCPRTKKSDVEVSSTTALILEQRPKGLPSKDPEEELRHKQEYEAMVEAAKKREVKEAKQKKRMMQQQLKQEEALTAALRVWNSEILTNWDSTRNSKKARDLWWLGIPPSVRGKVWKLAIGNELNLTSELYEICLNRAKDRLKLINETSDSEGSQEPAASKESSVELIKLDVSRTFPPLCIFQKGGPYHELLQGLLGAYACYRPDVGYVQGMSFIAAVLLLNMEEADAFICFANLLNRPCQIAFFRLDESLMKSYFETYEEFFLENLPKLYDHFEKQGLTPDLYIIDWMFTLYAKSLPLDVASRVWDVFCRDGEEFLFRTALGILKMYEEVLLNMDFIHLAQFLTKLPDNISGEQIFHCVESIHMTIDKRKFNQVLANVRDLKET